MSQVSRRVKMSPSGVGSTWVDVSGRRVEKVSPTDPLTPLTSVVVGHELQVTLSSAHHVNTDVCALVAWLKLVGDGPDPLCLCA